MPSNQTTNYQLSQWAKSDQVRMEDFNADNAKIDAALAALKSTVYNRSGGSASTNTTQMFQSISSLKWAEHDICCAYFFFPGIDAHLSKPLTVSLSGKTLLDATVQDFMLVFFPFRDPEQKARGLLLCETPRFFQFDRTYSQLTSVSMSAPQGTSLFGYTFFGIC